MTGLDIVGTCMYIPNAPIRLLYVGTTYKYNQRIIPLSKRYGYFYNLSSATSLSRALN